MTAIEFFRKVVSMRDMQRMYEKTAAPEYLQRKKQFEAEIDNEIKRVQRITEQKNNPKLF